MDFPHSGQNDPGCTMDIFSGILYMHTLIKLPMQIPDMNRNNAGMGKKPVIIKLLPFNKGLKYIVFLYRTLKIFLQGYCKTENMVYCKG
jgi:hypothetical protein